MPRTLKTSCSCDDLLARIVLVLGYTSKTKNSMKMRATVVTTTTTTITTITTTMMAMHTTINLTYSVSLQTKNDYALASLPEIRRIVNIVLACHLMPVIMPTLTHHNSKLCVKYLMPGIPNVALYLSNFTKVIHTHAVHRHSNVGSSGISINA
uniref:Uncharacterized protein n=1 Tax=Glossina austeni TaxID=7395 RepID=A0A1A9V0M9_GLOAU